MARHRGSQRPHKAKRKGNRKDRCDNGYGRKPQQTQSQGGPNGQPRKHPGITPHRFAG